jgi:quercetin dioxygenase-like cupin family protein
MTKENELQIIEPGRGKHIMISEDIISILLAKNQTNRTYSIVEGRISPGGGSPSHIQTREYMGYYILDGELVFDIEGKQVISKAGTVINIPPNVIRSFKNNTDNVVRVLIMIAPAGMEKLFEEVGTEVFDINIAKTSSSSDEEKKRLIEISKKYGVEILQ